MHEEEGHSEEGGGDVDGGERAVERGMQAIAEL